MKKTISILLVLTLGLVTEVAKAASNNQAPIADAGLPRYAGPDPVVLDGTGSFDPDNSGPLSYTWRQFSGPSVVIIDANTATPSIGGSMVPSLIRGQTHTLGGFTQTDVIQECEFELVVSDGELTSLPDIVKVIIVPDWGNSKMQQVNPPFDPHKPTVINFAGGDCVTGGGIWNSTPWEEKANMISFPHYEPDSGGGLRTYYRCGDIIIVYLSSVAPDYKQPIQTIGHSTGGDPAMDVGIHLNRVYRDARYAVNHVTELDAPCRWDVSRDWYFDTAELFWTSAVDGEQCWVEFYFGTPYYLPFRDTLAVCLFDLSHGDVKNWYRNSLTGSDMNKFNSGVVAGAYWSVVGPGKNLQLAPGTDAFYFRWDGDELSGSMSFFDEELHPGRLPEPITLVGPEDGAFVDANGVVLSCEVSENSIGYQLLFGRDPYHMVYLLSDTPNPPNELVTIFPYELTWWTVRAYDQYGTTIYADPACIYTENIKSQTIENATTKQTYASIQQAINNAHPGDEIVISPGICQYQEKIDFKGKNLTLRSTDPNDPDVVAETIINGGQQGSVTTLSGSQDRVCMIAGLTITGGTVGISCRDASLTIRNCTIESNGPIAIEYWYDYEPIIIDCTILGQVKFVSEEPGLVAHWSLDETEGDIAYDSAGDREGTVHGNPAWQPDGGKVHGALEFDGVDDYISAPYVLKTQPDAFSVFAWIKGGMPGHVIFSQKGRSNWLCADATNGNLMTELRFLTRPDQPLISAVYITDSEWHRVGLVWDDPNRILYVDDVEVISDTYVQGPLLSDLHIGGGKNLDAGSFWSGLIDDVRIYNRAIKP